MKVGILTFHFVDNYGAMLQVYALQNMLFQKGIEAEIIDYRPDFIRRNYKLQPSDVVKHPRKFLSYIVQYSFKKNQHRKFESFLNRKLKISNKTITEINVLDTNEYDFFITGSDQIWNKRITGSDKAYFLNFVKEHKKKIAYAASIGSEIDDEVENFVLSNIEHFTKVSVREKQVAEYFYNKNKIFKTVVDPVFLIQKSTWVEVEKKPVNIPEKYVFVYDLEGKKDILEMAKIKAEELNCSVISVHPLNANNNGHKNMDNVGPEEFVYLINNAEYVYTNSFHALAFSVIFNTNICVINHSTRNSRLQNIIELFELSEVSKEIYGESIGKVYKNGENTKKIIDIQVSMSLEFLFNSMNLKIK